MIAYIISPLEQFKVYPLFFISLTNLTITLLIPTIILLLIIMYRGKNPILIPSRLTILINIMAEVVWNLINSSMGKLGRVYFPIIFTLAWVLSIINLLGLAPFVFAATSHVLIAIFISLSIWLGVVITGIRIHGVNYLTVWIPAGSPIFIAPLLIVVEAVSFVSRAFSLGLRLAVNITAGHLLLGIIAGFAWTALKQFSVISISATFPILLISLIYILEVGVALVQAYVFTLLVCLYLADSLTLH
jgi:ATP synthase subunit 6